MECGGSVPSHGGRRVRWLPALALAAVIVFPRTSAAGSITGTSWDGTPPGTLADISGHSIFSFGLGAFDPGVYEVTWFGGVSAWRNFTTIGIGDQTLFDPGDIAPGSTQTVAMTDPWTMWATTPDLWRAESTGEQWAFTSIGAQRWAWGLEDIALGRCDCDYQDAYGMLARVGDVTKSLTITSDPYDPPTPFDPPRIVEGVDDVLASVPEPGTIALVTLGLAGLAARRRLRQR
jgi:hypothetical protein